jgi:hypothetical protein
VEDGAAFPAALLVRIAEQQNDVTLPKAADQAHALLPDHTQKRNGQRPGRISQGGLTDTSRRERETIMQSYHPLIQFLSKKEFYANFF